MTARTPRWRHAAAAALVGAACGAVGAGCGAGPIDAIDIDSRSLTQDLIAYWSFDEGSGATLHDQTTHHYDGAIAGATWIAAPGGRFGGALRFSTGEVTVPNFPQPAPTDSWSVVAWVRPSSATATGTTYATVIANELLRKGGWEFNLRYPMEPPAYQFGYYVGPLETNYTYFDCVCVTLSQWTHVAAVLDASTHTLSFYRNGHFDGDKTAMDGIKPGTDTLYMARWPTESTALATSLGLEPEERRLNGDLDEVAIYGRALGPGEISALTRRPIGPVPP